MDFENERFGEYFASFQNSNLCVCWLFKNREQSFEINSFRIIYGTCRPGGDRKREYYFLEGI